MSNVIVALIIIILVASIILLEISLTMMGLFICGIGLGISLFHGAYGFTAHWRRHILGGSGSGFRSELILIALTGLVFFFIVGNNEIETTYVLTKAPIGLSLILGSFIFGFGMQLANGCGSGVMFSLGAGSLRMIITLLFFMIGSLIGTIILPDILDVLSFPPLVLQDMFGYSFGYSILLLLLAGLFLFSYSIEKKRYTLKNIHNNDNIKKSAIFNLSFPNPFSIIQGPWPLPITLIAITLFSTLILLLSGFPWSVTFGITIWAGKIVSFLGIDISNLAFWQWPRPAQALENTILSDVSSTVNIGLLLGSLLAASLQRQLSENTRMPLTAKSLYAAIIGGLLLGIGARLGFGCNIGAFYSGTASGSLHGFVWLLFAFLGSIIGVSTRPYFNLENKI